MLPEAVSASIFPEQVVAPIREMLARGRFIMGRVNSIDTRAKTLSCAWLAGKITVHYDHLVIAIGNRARLDLIPGLAEHALPLKTVGDAMCIRNAVLRRVARIELECAADVRRRLGHFVIIGGGFSGVEVAGELVDCLKSIRRYYPRVAADELKVTVLQEHPRLLPELSESLGAAAHRSLAERGVDVRTMTRASVVSDISVALANGTMLDTATVICTIGTRPNALLERLEVPLEQGRIAVNADLSVRDTAGVWAIGDCARVPNAHNGSFAPPTAQFAVREARSLARNLLAVLSGGSTSAFDYRARGSMATIGRMNGVADVFGVPLTGLAAWLLWRAYYLSQMPTLRRKLRIFVESTWGMFFSNDVTHLRFTRSQELVDKHR
jgi:NADH dehydrogenase